MATSWATSATTASSRHQAGAPVVDHGDGAVPAPVGAPVAGFDVAGQHALRRRWPAGRSGRGRAGGGGRADRTALRPSDTTACRRRRVGRAVVLAGELRRPRPRASASYSPAMAAGREIGRRPFGPVETGVQAVEPQREVGARALRCRWQTARARRMAVCMGTEQGHGVGPATAPGSRGSTDRSRQRTSWPAVHERAGRRRHVQRLMAEFVGRDQQHVARPTVAYLAPSRRSLRRRVADTYLESRLGLAQRGLDRRGGVRGRRRNRDSGCPRAPE